MADSKYTVGDLRQLQSLPLRMKVTHPKQYAYCMDKLGLREVLEYIGVPYE